MQNIVMVEVSIAKCDRDDAYLPDDGLRFHEKMGYRKVGVFSECGYKFGAWYDLCWMEKRIAEPKEAMQPMLPFSAVQGKFTEEYL